MMLTINGEPFNLDTKVENEILFLRDLKTRQAEEIALLEGHVDKLSHEIDMRRKEAAAKNKETARLKKESEDK